MCFLLSVRAPFSSMLKKEMHGFLSTNPLQNKPFFGTNFRLIKKKTWPPRWVCVDLFIKCQTLRRDFGRREPRARCKPSHQRPAWMHRKGLADTVAHTHTRSDWSGTPAPDLHGSTRGRWNNDLQLSFGPPPSSTQTHRAPTLQAETKTELLFRQTAAGPYGGDCRYTHARLTCMHITCSM